MGADRGQRSAGKIRDESHHRASSARVRDRHDLVPADAGADAGAGARGETSDMFHRPVLQVEDVEVRAGVRELEDELLTGSAFQTKVLIPFARQGVGRGGQPVVLSRQSNGVFFAEPWSVSDVFGHSGSTYGEGITAEKRKAQSTQRWLPPATQQEKRRGITTDYLARATPGTQFRTNTARARAPGPTPRLDEVCSQLKGRKKRQDRRGKTEEGRQPRPRLGR